MLNEIPFKPSLVIKSYAIDDSPLLTSSPNRDLVEYRLFYFKSKGYNSDEAL